MMLIADLTYCVQLTEIEPVMAAHLAWVAAGYADGVFLASGPKQPRNGGVILARGSRAALEARLAQDPFVLAGLCRYDITEFLVRTAAPDHAALQELVSP